MVSWTGFTVLLQPWKLFEIRQCPVLEHGAPFHITPGLRHRMIALEDTRVLEVSTTELDDVVRLDDRYGRAR